MASSLALSERRERMKKEVTEETGSVVTFYDAEKFQTILMYAKIKGVDVNRAMTDTLDRLYLRCVPPSVQDFLAMKRGGDAAKNDGRDGE